MKKLLIFCICLILCTPAICEKITYQTPVNWDEEAWAPAFFAASKIHRNYNKSTFTKFMDEYDKLIKNKKTREVCLADLVEAYRKVFPKLKYAELEEEINRFKEVLISKQNEVAGSDLYMETSTGLQAMPMQTVELQTMPTQMEKLKAQDTQMEELKAQNTQTAELQAMPTQMEKLKAQDTQMEELKALSNSPKAKLQVAPVK